MKARKCPVCGSEMQEGGYATQVFRRESAIVTVTGVPAVRICTVCLNAVLEWSIAQQVEDLVAPLFAWKKDHSLPAPVVNVVFPVPVEAS